MRDSDREFLKELVRLDVSQTDCSNTRKILETCGDVGDTLANPLVTHDEKRGIINKLFPESMHLTSMKSCCWTSREASRR